MQRFYYPRLPSINIFCGGGHLNYFNWKQNWSTWGWHLAGLLISYEAKEFTSLGQIL